MTESYRPLHTRPSGEGELGWIGVSALIHAAGIAAIAFLPTRLPAPQPMESYTVDLVAPSTVGGTNLIPGRPKEAKKPAAPPKVEAPPAQARLPEPKPPVAEPEAKAKVPEVPPKPVEEKPKEEAAPPPKPEVEKLKEVEKPKVEEAPKPPQPPKAEAKPVQPEAKEAPPVAAAKPAAAAKEPPKVEKPAEAAPAKAEPPPPPQAKPKEPAKAEKAVAEKPVAAAQAKPDKVSDVDRRIAEAVQRRAKQVQATPGAAPGEIDRQIAAAVERKARNLQAEAKGEGGGPISYGPGEGSGGVVRGVDYILYRGHMEDRIKAAWAWAGANRALRAVVRFNILENGEIVNVQIVTPSGDPSYDSSIERALRAASPLNPPPEKYRAEFSTVELEFRPEDLES